MPEISNIIRVTDSIVPRGELRRDFGVTLFITTDGSILDAQGSGRVRTYSSINAVGEDFPTTSQPYEAAQRYFSQEPFPKALKIARWAQANVPSVIRGGGRLASAPSNSGANRVRVADGSLRILETNVDGITTTANTDWAGIATTLTSAINGTALSGFTVTYDAPNNRLVISDAQYRDLSGLVTTSTGTVGTDLSGLLNLDESSDATSIRGSAATTLSAGLNGIEDIDSGFYFVTIEQAYNDTATAVELDEWVAARKYHAFLETSHESVLTASITNDDVEELVGNESSRTNLSYSSANEYLCLSAAARLSSVNLASVNSLITLNLKVMPGVDPDLDLTQSQITNLRSHNINYYTRFGSSNAYRDGRNLRPGIWTDVRFALDWFTNAVQVDVFNLLYSSNRLPQTPVGIAAITRAIEDVCNMAVRNGMIAPGRVSASTQADIRVALDDETFDGNLSSGYLVTSAALADQAQADREARKAPPFRVFLKGSGAVHSADIDIRFEN